MIPRLRRRLTLLVVGVVALVTLGIVLSIHLIDLKNIDATAATALQVLAENRGQRPAVEGRPDALPQPPDAGDATPPPKPAGDDSAPPDQGPLRPVDMGGGSWASLSNAYTVRLDDAGEITGWSSDRADLYTDAQVRAVAGAALATGKARGRVDTQYFSLVTDEAAGARAERCARRRWWPRWRRWCCAPGRTC